MTRININALESNKMASTILHIVQIVLPIILLLSAKTYIQNIYTLEHASIYFNIGVVLMFIMYVVSVIDAIFMFIYNTHKDVPTLYKETWWTSVLFGILYGTMSVMLCRNGDSGISIVVFWISTVCLAIVLLSWIIRVRILKMKAESDYETRMKNKTEFIAKANMSSRQLDELEKNK